MKSGLRFITIDVSALAPPEPMTVILTHLAKLIEAGFSYHCVEHAQDDISLYIFHQSVQALFEQTSLNSAISKGKNE